MANSIPWRPKKRQQLLAVEEEFTTFLTTCDNDRAIAAGAERVRQAIIVELRSRRAELPPSEKAGDAAAELSREIAYWTSVDAAQIVDRYRT